MSHPRYYLMLPVTKRSGPGTKSHLSEDRKSTLCKIENNARIQLWKAFGWRKRSRKRPPDWPLLLSQLHELDVGARKLCANCLNLAKRREP